MQVDTLRADRVVHWKENELVHTLGSYALKRRTKQLRLVRHEGLI